MAKQMLVSCAKNGCKQMVILDLEPAKTIDDVRRELKNAFWDSRIESGVEYDLCPMHRILAEIKPDRFEYVICCSPMGGGSHVDDKSR